MNYEENYTIQERRLQALEMIHAISTAFNVNSETIYDLTILAINNVLKNSNVIIYEFNCGNIVLKSKKGSTGLFCDDDCSTCSTCIIKNVSTGNNPFNIWQNQLHLKSNCNLLKKTESIITAPILDIDGVLFGMIIIIGVHGQHYNDKDIHLIDLFSRFLSSEITRNKNTECNSRKFKQDLVLQLASGITTKENNRFNCISVNVPDLLSNVVDMPMCKDSYS